jgi:anthranilate synthase component 1
VPVVDTLSADLLTPLAVYLKLSAGSANSFLLESVEGGETLARYSFIGVDPFLTVTGNDEEIELTDPNGTTKRTMPIVGYLREHFAKYKVYEDGSLPSFIGGAIGAMNFSCSSWFEPTLKSTMKPGDDLSTFMFFRSIVAFDHAKQTVSIVSLVFTDDVDGDELDAAFEAARAKNSEIKDLLEHGELHLDRSKPDGVLDPPASNWSKEDFENAVAEIKELIRAGEAYQVVLSQCFSVPTNASPVSIYRAIRRLNPSPYMFLLRNGSRSIIGASPEMLVRVRGRNMEYRPIAGTRPRGATPDEDARLAEEMRADRKEVAEHLMLVDLGRNDLGRVAEYGSVKVDSLMHVEKYSHVQHLVSFLSAKLRDGLDRFDALASCFPAGTVSGAPKVRAIEIIEQLEPSPRGVYAGTVGYIDYAGNLDTCIAIRALSLENGVAKVQAGAGIVADSVPEREFEETVNKAKAMIKAIEAAESQEQ